MKNKYHVLNIPLVYIQPVSQHLTLEQLLSYLEYKLSYFEFSYKCNNAGGCTRHPVSFYFQELFKVQLCHHTCLNFDISLFTFGGAHVYVQTSEDAF